MGKQSQAWFIKVRGSYLPNTWKGWLTYVPFVVYLVFVIVDLARSDATAKQAVYTAFPQFVCAGVAMTWIAAKTSK